MKIGILHDYADMFRKSAASSRLEGHEITVHTGTEKDPVKLASLLDGCEAAVFTQQRVAFPRAAVERSRSLRFISQTGRNAYHIDLDACTERVIVVSAGGVSAPVGEQAGNFASTVELTFAMMMMSMRHLPFEVERFRQGHWQSTVGSRLFGKTLGVYAYGHIGKPVARVGRAFGMKVLCWGRETSTANARADGFDVAPGREAFYESSDVVTLHLPSN